MRLISQDKMRDVPYEHTTLTVLKAGRNAYRIEAVSSEFGSYLAEYDSLPKCLKVLEMLHETLEDSYEYFFYFPENDCTALKEL